MKYLYGSLLMCMTVLATAAPQKVEVIGLFKGTAVLEIDGKQRLVKQGATSPEGVKLVEASSKFARLMIDGKTKKYFLSRKIGTSFDAADSKKEVRINGGYGGHYETPGRINNRPANFLVDTGATYVSMNSVQAKRLGLDYLNGDPVIMSTANGQKRSYRIKLDSVTVGSVTVRGVRAVVSEGNFPEVILLGNSYLSRVEMRVEAGVMVLQSKI